MISLAAAMFILTSTTFKANAVLMPLSTVYPKCGGSNVSPQLRWDGAPKGTKSFAMIMHDPDAPMPGGWYHWVVYNLPASTRELPPGATIPQAELGRTSFGDNAYGGPCPPPGKPHHYNFTLYALDVAKIPGNHLTGPQLQKAIKTHTIGKAVLTGLYGR